MGLGLDSVNRLSDESAGASSTSTGLWDSISNFGSWMTTPIGTGQSAMSPLGYGLAAYSILANDKRQRQQLALAKQNLALQKSALQGNFTQNATNWMNQNLWQTQAMYNFDQAQGAKRAGDVLAGLNQLNSAASSLGMGDNAFGQQKDALMKYTQLKPNVNSQGAS